MTDLIWVYTKQGNSHEYIELQIFKEYLFDEIKNLRKELNTATEKSEKGGVSPYVINIFTKTFEDRIKHLESIGKNVIEKINKLKIKK